MTRCWPRLLLACLLFVLAHASTVSADTERRLVLVTDKNSGIIRLSTSEIRRLFLGFPVNKDGRQLVAAINQGDTLLYQVFLQKVVFMSANVYELHLLSNVVQLGGQLPQIFLEPQVLAENLHNRPGMVSFMWDSTAGAYPNVVVIGELWRGSTD